jgi:hypothetical protein
VAYAIERVPVPTRAVRIFDVLLARRPIQISELRASQVELLLDIPVELGAALPEGLEAAASISC